MLGVSALDAVPAPFTHSLVDGVFEPNLFQELREQFPKIRTMNRPAGWGQSLYWGEEDYERHLERSPAWRRVFEAVHSQSFVDFIVEQFRNDWSREGCTLDLSRVRYVPYCETRSEKERLHLELDGRSPTDLYCRLDFYESYGGYYRPLHLDQRRRLISMLVYMDDQEEIGMIGGELFLHAPGPDLRALARLGLYHAPKAYSRARERLFRPRPRVVKPRRNRMAMFLCGRTSWHSVAPVRSRLPRRHVHILISSFADIWE